MPVIAKSQSPVWTAKMDWIGSQMARKMRSEGGGRGGGTPRRLPSVPFEGLGAGTGAGPGPLKGPGAVMDAAPVTWKILLY